jgi:anti-sigma factor RsiW
MEHSESIETMAAERYALGEMTPEERDLFEEHFFDCRECAPSVRDGVAIAAETRAAGARAAAAKPGIPVRQWSGIAASAAFVVLLGYQNLVTIPHLRSTAARATNAVARLVHPQPLLTAGTRAGGTPPVVTAARDEDVEVYFDILPESPYASYVAVVHDLTGKARATIPIPVSDAGETVTILVPAGVLAPANYSVTVSGIDAANRRTFVGRYPFELRFH